MKHYALTAAVALGLLFLGAAVGHLALARPDAARAADPAPKDADPRAQLDQVRAELKWQEGLLPDQAAVMTHVAYHWGNLWFALEAENWPLADFYLGETRANLKWAVRVRPVRVVNKETIDLKSIAEAVDNAPLTQMKAAIARKDRKACVKLYDDTLTGCYACHKASDKPYLRPRRPESPEVRVINFDPKARQPE